MEIREILRRKHIEMVDRGTMVAEAIKRMAGRSVGTLIVRRSTFSDPYGIVTRSDIIFKVIAKGLDPNVVKVDDIVSSPLVILNSIHLDVRYAAQTMANSKVSTIAIFDAGDFYGLLNITDIVNALAMNLQRQSLDDRSGDISGGC
jgi:predicted transcriptional regulator